jgi:putative endonuclease
MSGQYYVYIMTSQYHTVLYTGVTNDISNRAHQHAAGVGSAFTRRYNVDTLVYVERFTDAEEAIRREKQIKGYSRKKKVDLILAKNPGWRNLLEPPCHSERSEESLTPSSRSTGTDNPVRAPSCRRDDKAGG